MKKKVCLNGSGANCRENLILVSICLQGAFSYWRAFSEYAKPYVTDIGYSEEFSDYIVKNCDGKSSVHILDPNGIHFFKSFRGGANKKDCGKLVVVMRDHFKNSNIIKWFLEKKLYKTDMIFKDYIIWSSNKNI